ncbi:MAG: DUF1318 domain-containing protein [Candidatus Omnitrophota bacterium]
MNKKPYFLAIVLLALSSGCYVKTEHKITAHITIDVRQIKEAASSIEDMVSGAPVKKEAPQTKPNSRLWVLPREAYAQGAQLKYLTDEIKLAIEKRKARYSQIEQLLNEGSVGENNQGILEIRSSSQLLSDKELKNIVSEENNDRLFIYRSILEQNNLPREMLKDIQAAFAKERRDRVEPGVWIQLPDGEWVRK